MKPLCEEKLTALRAARDLLLEVMDLSCDSPRHATIIDLLDHLDDYLRYVENLEALESVELPGHLAKQESGRIYQLMKQYRQHRRT